MLKIDNLSYRYPSRKQFTLKNINLTLADGEMLLLAGRSGCGKSTLIKAVSGLLGSEERGELQGAIYLQGEDISKWPPEKTGQLVGTVYQSPDDQLFAMTVADEVGFALENQGEEPEVIARKVSETLQLVGLGGSIRPSCITARREKYLQSSFTRCSIIKIAMPASRLRRTKSCIKLCTPCGFIWLTGSSKIKSPGLVTRIEANAKRCLWPPLSLWML